MTLASATTLDRLSVLLQRFDHNGSTSRNLINQLLEAGRSDFYHAAVELLKTPRDTRAFQYLVSLLVAESMLLPALCDPQLTINQMMAAARAAQRVDSNIDIALARALADGVMADDAKISLKNAARLLEVLDQISDSRRILASLMRLLRHPSPHLRSKAVKLIGRGSRSPKWVQGRLAEPDPRVRANAIETLHGVDTPEARELLLACVHDSDNRVTGNALVALHHLGDAAIVPEFLRVAAHDSPRFRASAAWAMGQTADARFSEALARLMRDSDAAVRSRAFDSLGRIKQASAEIRKLTPWLLAAAIQENAQTGQRRLHLCAASESGGEFPAILGTHVMLSEDQQRVVSYRFNARPAPDAMSLSFVFPRVKFPAGVPWIDGAASCAPWKRTSDLWGLKPYLAGDEAEGADGPAEEVIGLTADVEAFRAALLRPSKRAACAGFWTAVQQGGHADQGGTRGKRHVIIFNNAESLYPAPDEVIASVLNGGQVQAVSSVPCPVLEDFCRRVRGTFHLASTPEQIISSIRNCYLLLLARYEVIYTPLSPECRAVKVRLQTPAGWAEAMAPVFG